jgi:NADH:ubiquinone oxidoreductase subunit 2 (subunit N)
MNTLLKIAVAFLALTGATTLMMNYTEIDFGTANFWDKRGVFFLFFVTLFPRLTLLFSSVAFGGVLWWLAFFFTPRFLVATLATISYWESNPLLVIFSWLIAISGETGEKHLFNTQVRVVRTGGRPFTRESFSHTHVDSGETIEAEFREIK